MNSPANPKQLKKETPWSNQDNGKLYEQIKAPGLKAIAESAGLADGCDMNLLKSYWQQATNLLEVGAGYGRVINYLLQHQFTGNITAIERCCALCKHLEKKYSNSITLLKSDLNNLPSLDPPPDLILWLWSGISEFNTNEQPAILKKLANLLSNNGVIILDTMPANTVPLGMEKQGQGAEYTLKKNNAVIHTYSMSLNEVEQHATFAGLSTVEHRPYKTSTGRERFLHILSR